MKFIALFLNEAVVVLELPLLSLFLIIVIEVGFTTGSGFEFYSFISRISGSNEVKSEVADARI